MRVLQILEASSGGAARHVVDLCLGLALQGVEVHLAYSPLRMDRLMREGLSRLREAGVFLVEIPMQRAPHPSDLAVIYTLRRYLNRGEAFDLVHGHSSKGGGVARLLRLLGGPKVVYTPNAFVTLAPNINLLERKIFEVMERVLSPYTSALIAVSEAEAQEALRLGFSQEHIHLIPNGITLHNLHSVFRKEIRLRWGLGEHEVVIGFVGRLVPQKAPEFLLEAFAKVASNFQEARLVIVGDGPLDQLLKEKVRKLHLDDRVLQPGFMKGHAAFPAFDIFALPSTYEGFPYVLLEALAAGLPIVATRVGGTEMAIVEGENGFVVPVGDIEGFANGLAKLLGDEVLRKSFGQRSLERAQDFSVEKMVNKTLALYYEIAK